MLFYLKLMVIYIEFEVIVIGIYINVVSDYNNNESVQNGFNMFSVAFLCCYAKGTIHLMQVCMLFLFVLFAFAIFLRLISEQFFYMIIRFNKLDHFVNYVSSMD